MFDPLPQLLRVRREKLNLSQGEVAKRAGVGRAQYALLEAGKANITLSFLVKVARVLGISAIQVDDLYIRGASPDLKTLVRAQEAVAKAKELAGQFSGAITELDEVSSSLDALIAAPLESPGPHPGIVETAHELTKLGRGEQRSSAARTLRELARADHVHRAQRPDTAASAPARKRGPSSK